MIRQDLANMSNLMRNERPAYNPDDISVLSRERAYQAFERITESRIQFNYTQGNCHDRAHIMSLMLAEENITCAKIWAFAPGNYSLIDRTLFTINDKNDISPNGIITWGYHVAPVVNIQDNHGHSLQVIDPSLFPGGPVPYEKWLQIFKNERGIYLFLNSSYYLFNTLDNNAVFNTNIIDPETCDQQDKLAIPNWFPKIITGDFFNYDGDIATDDIMPKGLALNETAYQFYKNEIAPLAYTQTALKEELKAIVGVVDDFNMFLQQWNFDNPYYTELNTKHRRLLEQYKNIYEAELQYWKDIHHIQPVP